VCGRATTSGAVEVCNAGHLPPLLIQEGKVTSIAATGLPVGVFCNESFSVSRMQMNQGDGLFLYTDGLSESQDGAGNEYGADRLSQLLNDNHALSTDSMISLCRQELHTFADGMVPKDDLTLMAIRRTK
jgi:sigma-B regulation protein RsbU (phosphoserine phosphatase)